MTRDLGTAKDAFWSGVQRKNTGRTGLKEEFSWVVDRLIEWSATQPRLYFEWHEGAQALIRYRVTGMKGKAAFWALYPKDDLVAFLIVMGDSPPFSEDLRKKAYDELSTYDRDIKEKYPVVHFDNLTPNRLEEILKLMDGWLAQVPPQ